MLTAFSALFAILQLLACFVTAIPNALKRYPSDSSPASPSVSTVQLELGPNLSKGASIYFPNSPDFGILTERWSTAADPDFAVVVVPAVANDVAVTVTFANAYNIPFLAVNRGHGTAAALSNVHHGISIYVRALNSISIAEDGNSASMGGGVFQDEAVNYLAPLGKAAASGACACVGMMGPGLGGGFGRYQGFFGLVTDNIIEMDVVIADGSMITVSASSNPDLYWGMRGAGHNFGIVTQFQYKIYDEPIADWFFVTLIFTQDKLEAFFEALNVMGGNGTQPKEIVTYTLYAMDPTISTTEPVIIITFEIAGTEAQAVPFLAPLYALNPAFSTNETVPYTGAAHASSAGLTDEVCQPGTGAWLLFPVGLEVYNMSTNRAIYNLFSEMIAENPTFNNSIVQFEAYAVQAMKAVGADSTAYAHRADNLLVSYAPFYPPSPELTAIAISYGRQARALFHAGDRPGRPLNAYVNYASDDETPEQLYGFEPWRLERLRDLKMRYDPKGKFDFYYPVG